ncbi:ABC transporter permease [Gulosibacter molinativorax]|uniref:ABC transporter permease n=1 Tax=Gulosibacter molinativorax TaxID=256821 RepID=A0ABT7CAV0_9MICO|nr:ABC transporter permease [Gulosibacter molinativorax]MDJ1371939.1 ABC transporter permease [Gulosibacter molinativorax]QUY62697.1 Ribose ABC transporter permease [Gulosibacter molinativorax]
MPENTTTAPVSAITKSAAPKLSTLNTAHIGLIVVIIIAVIITSIGTDAFLTTNNILNVLKQVSVLAVIAAGLTMLMISGGIDFSLGSNLAVTMGIVAQMLTLEVPTLLAITIGLICATAIGFVNGIVVTYTKVTPFVATLATATLLDGLALVVIDGLSVSAQNKLYEFGNGAILGIPYILLAAIVICVVVALVLRYTSFGRNTFAMGGNEEVARLTGIPVARNKILLYSMGGMLAGIAGVMLLARLGAASPGIGGLSLELQAVAAVVIGGTSLVGGKGSILGSVLGVLLLGIVANALNLLGVSSYFQAMSVGAVLLIAAILNVVQWRRRKV